MAVTAAMALVATSPLTPAAATGANGDTGTSADRSGSTTAVIDDEVQDTLDEKGAADYWVVFDRRADLDGAAEERDWTARGRAVVDRLQATAKQSQAEAGEVLSDAGVTYQPYWISNRILVRGGDTALTDDLATLPGVDRIAQTTTVEYAPPEAGTLEETIQAVEWGIAAINADDVWDEYGVRGAGITVANNDTGVQFDHPALVDSYRGNLGGGAFDHNYNWFDPSGVCSTDDPCDWDGHGSHTMGTMAGEDGDNQIGVAPDVRWIAGMGCDLPPNNCSDEALLGVGQWTLEPRDLEGENPRVDLRPHIVNNSWGGPGGDDWYDDVLQAWNDAGMFVVFANGNAGPGCGTTGSPADSPHAFGIGGFQANGGVYNNSSRGPGARDGLIRPNVSAPAVNVRSAVPPNTYANFTGTSMAAPHVAGAAALLWSAAPDLIGDVEETRDLLERTAAPVEDSSCGGEPEHNNVWGHGKVDALAAMREAPVGDVGTLTGTVTGDGSALIGATVTVTDGETTRRTETGEGGVYEIRLAAGTYTATATAFGYLPEERAVVVEVDEATVEDFALVGAPEHTVGGTVENEAGQPVAGATVSVPGTAVPPAVTGADGTYAFASVPAGTYTFVAASDACSTPDTQADVVVNDDLVLDFVLSARTDAFGYTCVVEDSAYTEGTTALTLTGDDEAQTIELPFGVWLYGEQYREAHISTNGYVGLVQSSSEYSNHSIPNPAPPNGAVYAFWDDLVMDPQSTAFTGLSGTAPNRQFVIELRDMTFFDGPGRIDTSITFHEAGEIVLSWRNLDPAAPTERGSQATVGIENADGSDALEFSFNEPVLSDDISVRFTLPPSGRVFGTVTDGNDRLPVAGATVRAFVGDEEVRATRTRPDGTYAMLLPVGSYRLQATANNYATVEAEVEVVIDREVRQDFVLATARAEIDVETDTWVLPAGYQQSGRLWVVNSGTRDLEFEIGEAGGGRVTGTSAPASPVLRALAKAADPDARDTSAHYTDMAVAAAEPQAPGDVIASWPTGLGIPWGVGYTGDLWLSDPELVQNFEFTTAGARTGVSWPADWAGDWNGDMAFDTASGSMCQVNVGGDNGIYCWDPGTGEVAYSLTGSPWSGTSQRGLAYSPGDDTFYITGWNEDVLYHVAGQSHADPGATLSQCGVPGDHGASGLAWHGDSGTIWVATNSPTSPILRLDPATCQLIESIGHPEAGEEFAGAGLSMDDEGNLWMASQMTGTAYLVDSGLPSVSDVPWLDVEPASGRVAPGDELPIEVTVDSSGLEPGVYRARLVIDNNSGRRPRIEVPVELVVPDYWNGINAGSTSGYTDVGGLPWSADREYRPGRVGWIGPDSSASQPLPPNVDIARTRDDELYRTHRVGLEAYRFDNLPGGTYEVTLDFAERQVSPRVDWRVFDVDVDGRWAMVGYDIARQVGGRTADRHTVTVEVEDGGDLTVTFHQRRGYQPPLINAIRVVERPDL